MTTKNQPCIFYFRLRDGSKGCDKGNDCSFSHDPSSLSGTYCPTKLKTGKCGVKTCPFSHDVKNLPRKSHLFSGQPVLAAGVLLWKRINNRNFYYAVETHKGTTSTIIDTIPEESMFKNNPVDHEIPQSLKKVLPDSMNTEKTTLKLIGSGEKFYSEPGGKAEHCDNTALETAAREFKEETGNVLPTLSWNCMYFPHAKYLLFMSQVPDDFNFENNLNGAWVPYSKDSFVRIANHMPL